jgi:hypothetical protein
MGENRESVILVKSPSFKEEDTKFSLVVRVDFGTQQCTQRMEQSKAFGVEPSANCIVITHDFETEEAAQQAAAKAMELKGVIPPLKDLESAKALGKKLVVFVRPDEGDLANIKVVDEFAKFVGDFAAINEYFELRLASSRDLKALLGDPSASPLALAAESICLKATLSFRKDLPIKIANFAASRSTSAEEQKKLKLAGHVYAAFHHITYTVDLKEPTGDMRETLKEPITGMMMMGAQMAYGMLSQLGIMEIAKAGGTSTRATLLMSSLLSFEVNLIAPKGFEVLTQLASQAMGGAPGL